MSRDAHEPQREHSDAMQPKRLPDACAAFRRERLDALWSRLSPGPQHGLDADGIEAGHAQGCAPCEGWWERRAEAFAEIRLDEATERAAPDSLADRVRLELEEPTVRVARRFARLQAQQVPAALDASVEELLADLGPARDTEGWESRSAAVRALRTLPRQTAPPVLHRLVEEELTRPLQSFAERYVGGLSPLSAPDLLTERCQSALEEGAARAGERRASPRPTLVRAASVVAPLAAALLVVVALRANRTGTPEAAAGWRFEMVVVDDPSELGPAKGLLRGLVGGVLPEDVR